jgi:hypothetical protein
MKFAVQGFTVAEAAMVTGASVHDTEKSRMVSWTQSS